MQLLAYTAPRRVILAFLTLLGLSLRFWGLAWGPEQAGALHPGEWTWQIIDHLSWSDPTYPGIWTQAFFSFAALLKGLLSWVAGLIGLLLGEVRALAQVEIPARLAGRIAVALLGGGQIVLAYLVGRRFFDSVATGLLSAALVAVSPLLVAQSHYLSLDVPLGFAVLGCLCLAGLMCSTPRWPVMALSGLALGLCITTRASGALVAPVLLMAYVVGVRRARPALSRWLGLWPLAFLGGLVLGLILGYPGFVLRADQVEEVLQSSVSLSSLPTQGWQVLLGDRWHSALVVLWDSAGPELVALWLVGLSFLIWRRRFDRLLVALLPPLFFAAGVVFLSGSSEGLAAVWLPAALVVACWPLVMLCRLLPKYGWQVAAVGLLGLFFAAWPLWRSLQAGYIFWQQDTLTSAKQWLKANLPEGVQVLVEPGIPLDASLAGKPLAQDLTWQGLTASGDYVLISSLGQARKKDLGRSLSSYLGEVRPEQIPARLQLLKCFDLKSNPLQPAPAGPGFPLWVSPRVQIFAAKPRQKVLQPLALRRPGVRQRRVFTLVYGDQRHYSRFEGGAVLSSGQVAFRVLRLGHKTSGLGLLLSNQGADLALVRVSQGPWPGKLVRLYPGQEASLDLPARAWPPTNRGFYPCKLTLLRGEEVTARLSWDPLLRGRRAMEAGEYPKAAGFLEKLSPSQKMGFDAQAMLAAALARQKKIKQAAEVIKRIGPLEQEPARSYRALAAGHLPPAGWNQAFQRLTGYHPGLLRRAASLDCPVASAPRQKNGATTSIKGDSFSGSLTQNQAEGKALLTLWLDDPFPKGHFTAGFSFSGTEGLREEGKLGRVTIWSFGSFGMRKLGEKWLTGRELKTGRGTMELPFAVRRSGARLEVRIQWEPHRTLSVARLRVGADIKEHMRYVLRWYLEAAGQVALQAGRFPQAVALFDQLLDLAPWETRAYIPLARALMDTGKVEQAYQRTRAAEDVFQSIPARLTELVELYQAMRLPEDVQRVEKRLAHLKPSLKKEARFAGGLSLLGYDLPQANVKRGDEMTVNWYWRCWARPPLDYYIFVHLRGPGRTLNYDHLLDHGRLAMPELQVGQVVREDYRLRIPPDTPPGKYKLVVGLWDPRFTGKGVPIIQGTGRGGEEATLAEITVE